MGRHECNIKLLQHIDQESILQKSSRCCFELSDHHSLPCCGRFVFSKSAVLLVSDRERHECALGRFPWRATNPRHWAIIFRDDPLSNAWALPSMLICRLWWFPAIAVRLLFPAPNRVRSSTYITFGARDSFRGSDPTRCARTASEDADTWSAAASSCRISC